MKRWMLRLHLWVSLVFGLFIVAVSTTGSLLVVEKELESWLDPIPYEATAGDAGLEAVKRQAEAAYPGLKADRVTLPDKDGALYQVRLTGQQDGKQAQLTVFSDPGTGQVLGESGPRSVFFDYTLRLHRWLLLTDIVGRETANQINGAIAIAFIVVLVTGAFLWWPGLKRWASGFKVIWHKGRLLLNQGLHRSVGVTALPLLLVLAVTGAAYQYDKYVMNAMGIQRTVQAPADQIKVTPPKDGTAAPMPLDQLMAAVQKQHPDDRILRATLPAKPNQPVQLALKVGYTPNGNSNSTVYLNPYTGAELWQSDPNAGITRYQAWKAGLHRGLWGGLPVKILYVVIGMTPLGLMITGVVIWRMKARLRARAKVRAAARAA